MKLAVIDYYQHKNICKLANLLIQQLCKLELTLSAIFPWQNSKLAINKEPTKKKKKKKNS